MKSRGGAQAFRLFKQGKCFSKSIKLAKRGLLEKERYDPSFFSAQSRRSDGLWHGSNQFLSFYLHRLTALTGDTFYTATCFDQFCLTAMYCYRGNLW